MDYPGRFEISSAGKVRTIARYVKRIKKPHFKESILKKQRETKFGYLSVYLSINKRYKHYFVHVLVAQHFIGPRPTPKHQVNHIDGDKSNNNVTNLEWVTPSENLKHAFRIGLMNQNGEKHPSVKLNNKNVLEIVRSGTNYKVLAKKFGVSCGTIWAIRRGISWSHLTGIIYEKKTANID